MTVTDDALPEAIAGSRTWDLVLFDLDGTLVDSGAGIMASVAHALAARGHPVPAGHDLRSYVGPPLVDAFMTIGGVPRDEAELLVAAYRERYAGEAAVLELYPGAASAVRDLSARRRLALATSKPEPLAREILHRLGIDDHFAQICGATVDGSRRTKADVIASALDRCGADPTTTVMVGDRVHDVDGAAIHGIPTVGVTWGYARPGELEGAVRLVDTYDELLAYLTS